MEQAYRKAESTMSTTSEFVQIKAIYDEKESEIAGINRSGKRQYSFIVVFLLIMGIALLSMAVFLSIFITSNRQAREAELEAIVVEIERDIANGDYDAARIKANKLYMDESDSKDGSKSWDERREGIMRIIDNAEKGS